MISVLVFTMLSSGLAAQIEALPAYRPAKPVGDWLLHRANSKAQICRGEHADEIVLTNGLISRKFKLGPNAATVALDNLTTGESLLRAVGPEGSLDVDGIHVPIGGLQGQPDLAYLSEAWLEKMQPIPGSMQFESFEVGPPAGRLPWLQTLHHSPSAVWPPKGTSLTFHFGLREGPLKGLKADVHYEIYDGVPLVAKWLTVINGTKRSVRLQSFKTEILNAVEAESNVDTAQEWLKPPIFVATDYSFGGMTMNSSNRTVYWLDDPNYTTQVNYNLKTPCLLEVRPPLGPDVDMAAGTSLDTFHAFELVYDSSDRERKGLAVRQMFRTLAPWCTENPIMLHLVSTDPVVVRKAMDQAADVGFEMVIFSFGSGLDMEDVSPENIRKFREFRDYAHSKGLKVGGYSLLASRHIDDANDVISPKTGKPGDAIFGFSPCLGSEWAARYFAHMKTFLQETEFDLLEHDGSYPGDVCASTTHPGHRGLSDSQWTQYQTISEFYRWCREHGVYLNVPDNYFLAGSNKTGMGYRETNWSLPREQQHIHARQNLYDGTWEKTPSMGWMFVPLVEYQGGGAAATIEPLHEHLQDYSLHLANNLGYGAQACYRGQRIYDTPETRDMVKGWVDWFKKYRDILESDVIHVRRADGQNLDAVLHVNPGLATKAMAVVYNPGDKTMEGDIELPLYYAGLKGSCKVALMGAGEKAMRLDREEKLTIRAKVGPRSCVWYVIR